MEKQLNIYKRKREILFDNLIGGLGWAIGATIGFSLLLAVVGFVLGHINHVPVIGQYTSQLNPYVEKAQKK